MGSTLIARGFSDIGHVSGYTGHVMGIRECELGKSFGHITQAAGHTRLNPKDGRMCVLAEGGRFVTTPSPPFPWPLFGCVGHCLLQPRLPTRFLTTGLRAPPLLCCPSLSTSCRVHRQDSTLRLEWGLVGGRSNASVCGVIPTA